MLVTEMLVWGSIILASYLIYRKLRPEDARNSAAKVESTEGEHSPPNPYEDGTSSYPAKESTQEEVKTHNEKEVVICTECGAYNKPKYRFCRECIQDLRK